MTNHYAIRDEGGCEYDLFGDWIELDGDIVTVTNDGKLVGYVRNVASAIVTHADATTARYEREDTEARQDDPVSTEDRLRAALDSAAAQTHRARRAEAERDDAIARAESWRDANSGIHAERDAALDEVVRLRAKQAAFRADVEEFLSDHRDWTIMRGLRDVLDRDDARTPQADQ